MNKRKVLLVDDEARTTLLIKLNLEKTGHYEVQSVNDPQIALDKAKAFHPDVIVLDMVMPGMDGGDVKRRLREDPATNRIPIIFLTALVSNLDVTPQNPVVRNRDGIMIPKPVTTELLARCIEYALAGGA